MHTGLALTRVRYSATHTEPEFQMEIHWHLNSTGSKSLSSLVLGDFLLYHNVCVHSEAILNAVLRTHLSN